MKNRASRLFAEGKLQEALELYERIVEADPRELGCRIKAGDVYRRLGERQAAVAAYESVARQYADDGLLLKAIAVCKLILAADPGHTSTQVKLADLYARRRSGSPEVPSLPISRVAQAPAVDAMSTWNQDLGSGDVAPTTAILSAWPTPAGSDGKGGEAEAPSPSGAEANGVEPSSEGSDAPTALPLIPLFSDLPKKAFVEILVRMRMHQLRRGTCIIREGEDGDSFYIVASGLVSVHRKNSAGRETRLAHLGEGAFFGEMALLQGGLRTATVRVEEDAQVFEISRELLEEVIEQYPTVATAVRNFYRQRLLASAMATHALFAPFSAEARRNLMDQFKSRSFAPDEIILEEGKKGSGLYLLLHGHVQVTKRVESEVKTLAELSSGDVFGEMSLLTGEPTSATITSLDETFVLRLSKKRFDELILTNQEVLEFVGRLSDRRAEQNETVLSRQLDRRGAVLV